MLGARIFRKQASEQHRAPHPPEQVLPCLAWPRDRCLPLTPDCAPLWRGVRLRRLRQPPRQQHAHFAARRARRERPHEQHALEAEAENVQDAGRESREQFGGAQEEGAADGAGAEQRGGLPGEAAPREDVEVGPHAELLFRGDVVREIGEVACVAGARTSRYASMLKYW